ncbi:nucleolus and neural progenitor protein [Salarias fasciatus]|uniref:nucleolus and neural progenitor protein n=1 Tax=Salarias fasciatus TaxID=181472 RepID=UPI001176968D|nr:nucleolus and neural progenitor protein [Salarias fasciatus]
MAAELWNQVHIPFPSAVSTVRIPSTPSTVPKVQALLEENEKVLRVIRCWILQTEIRVLYELLYNLSNSLKGNKTFKGLKQVEQCINRLKDMKLDVALQELGDVCPNHIQRRVTLVFGECDVPSQPMLEWTCLKVLGAGQLMSRTLDRCSRAFVLSKQQMKWEEFVILNVVVTSMLSRLWVIFRVLLVSLSSLYERLLDLLGDVAAAQPMPFLREFSLPADMAHFLGPSSAFLLTQKSRAKEMKIKKSSIEVKAKKTEDFGVAIQREIANDVAMKPFFRILKNFKEGNSLQEKNHKDERKLQFKTQMRKAATFTLMASHMEEMIEWFRSQQMEKERRLLSFMHLKCQKMERLEAAGYNVQKKLRAFRRDALWASSPRGPLPKSLCSFALMRRRTYRKTRFQPLRSRFRSSNVRTAVKKKRPPTQRNGTELSESLPSEEKRQSRTAQAKTQSVLDSCSNDDIDDIFASIGL